MKDTWHSVAIGGGREDNNNYNNKKIVTTKQKERTKRETRAKYTQLQVYKE